MDKVFLFFKNRWVRLAVSLFSLGFPAFLLYVDWLAFAYSMEPTNPVPLFLLYVLVNFVFGGIMFYTRKQILTRLAVCLSPIPVFVMLIIAFGQWFMIVPPLVICVFVFLASGAGETLKTVLGTIYLLMFVVGTLAYMTLEYFNLTPQKLMDDILPDLSLRSSEYVYSTNNSYRLVRYVDQKNSDRVTVRYYVEDAGKDVHLWYLDCRRYLQSLCVLTTVRRDEIEYRWVSDTELYIDGRTKNIPELFRAQEEKDKEDDGEKAGSVKRPIIFDDDEEDDEGYEYPYDDVGEEEEIDVSAEDTDDSAQAAERNDQE